MPYINATFYDSSAVIHYNGQWPDGFPNSNQLILKTIITKQLLCSYKVALFELTEGERRKMMMLTVLEFYLKMENHNNVRAQPSWNKLQQILIPFFY